MSSAARHSPRPPTLARRPRVAEERLLDAATAVFAAEGFDGARMDAIAARAQTTKPTLYARFGSKEGLFAAAVAREYELRKKRLFEAYETAADVPFRARLRTWVSAYFELASERPEAFALISEGSRNPASAAIIEHAQSEIVDRIATLVVSISGRHAAHGTRLVAAMISGVLRSCAREALHDDQIKLVDAAALCESLLYSALRGLDPDLIDAVG